MTMVMNSTLHVCGTGDFKDPRITELMATFQLVSNSVIVIVSFMQGIYTYIPETIYIPREYSVAVILLFLFMVHIIIIIIIVLMQP
jgi:hypothetical protein